MYVLNAAAQSEHHVQHVESGSPETESPQTEITGCKATESAAVRGAGQSVAPHIEDLDFEGTETCRSSLPARRPQRPM